MELEGLKPEQIKEALLGLQSSLGWQILKDICEKNQIQNLRNTLLYGEHETLEQLKNLQYKLDVYTEIFNLPTSTIETIIEAESGVVEEEQEQSENDPYFDNIKDMEEAKD